MKEELPKPRCDSTLKTLPEKRQDEIAQFASEHSLPETVAWLELSGVETSKPALSRFLSWYRLVQQLDTNHAAISELLEKAATKDPTLSAERVHEVGNIFFAGQAIEKQDPKSWYMLQQTVLRKAELALGTEKFREEIRLRREVLARELDVAKSTGGISPETIKKIEQELNL